jgi:hypothetical protein
MTASQASRNINWTSNKYSTWSRRSPSAQHKWHNRNCTNMAPGHEDLLQHNTNGTTETIQIWHLVMKTSFSTTQMAQQKLYKYVTWSWRPPSAQHKWHNRNCTSNKYGTWSRRSPSAQHKWQPSWRVTKVLLSVSAPYKYTIIDILQSHQPWVKFR